MIYETRNTRLAAALVSLDYDIQPSEDFAIGAVVTLCFNEKDTAAPIQFMERQWRECNGDGVTPLECMHRVSTARDWIVTRVVHGTHNAAVTPPEDSYKTRNLNFACCLVAQQFYLIKLDKIERLFHFDARASDLWARYCEPEPDSVMDWQIKYLRNFDWLLRSIQSRKLVLDNAPSMRKTLSNLKRDNEKREIMI